MIMPWLFVIIVAQNAVLVLEAIIRAELHSADVGDALPSATGAVLHEFLDLTHSASHRVELLR